MTICGLASGSSEGRSATGLSWVAIMLGLASVIGGWGRAAALGSKKRALDNARPCHAALPYKLAIQINLGPDTESGLEMRCVHHGKRNITLRRGRPRRRCDAADLALPRRIGIQQGVVRRLVAFDIEADQQAARSAVL